MVTEQPNAGAVRYQDRCGVVRRPRGSHTRCRYPRDRWCGAMVWSPPSRYRNAQLTFVLVTDQHGTDRPARGCRWDITQNYELLALDTLTFQPVRASPWPIRQVLPFRHNTF